LDFLATASRRKILFGMLYLSEGAPIGFIWLGLPTRLRAIDVPIDRIAWLLALLIFPWTLKFLWAPAVDLLRGPRWGFKQWILASQFLMAVTLIPLAWLDLKTEFATVSVWLLMHAFSAATQDIAIDALCVQQSEPLERGSLNGWMQCGVLVGRAVMGGGSLVLQQWVGFSAVVFILIGLVLVSALLLGFSKETRLPTEQGRDASDQTRPKTHLAARCGMLAKELYGSLRSRPVWSGFLFALTAPAAFKSLDALVGPFLVDRGYTQYQVGQFTATAMIGGMIFGSLLAGRLANRFPGRRFTVIALVVNLVAIAALAVGDWWWQESAGLHLFWLLAVVSVSIGWFTVAMYQWLMNLTSPGVAATQFTAFMAATNACESWSVTLLGSLQVRYGYAAALLVLCGLSALAGLAVISLAGRSTATSATTG
jgi:MFS transporter (putative signal transducer)